MTDGATLASWTTFATEASAGQWGAESGMLSSLAKEGRRAPRLGNMQTKFPRAKQLVDSSSVCPVSCFVATVRLGCSGNWGLGKVADKSCGGIGAGDICGQHRRNMDKVDCRLLSDASMASATATYRDWLPLSRHMAAYTDAS